MMDLRMSLETKEFTGLDRITMSHCIRRHLAFWLTLTVLTVFTAVTLITWGWAAWWAVSKLIGLVF
jgi:hypothetical protein